MEEIALTSARLHRFSPTWRLKALLPIAGTLFAGLLLFAIVTLQNPQRHWILFVAAAGAIAICAVLLVVLAVLIQKPLLELNEKIDRLRAGDLHVAVGFARREDEIGELGRHFNEMVEQLRTTREEVERLHRTQMTRAEHLATLGELAAGLAHEIRNPLAGIAGVVEMIGRDLPANSPSREIVKEAQSEVRHIQNLLSDLLQYARPRPPQILAADLNETAEHAVTLARRQLSNRPIELAFAPDPQLPTVEHDPAQMQQVLVNLLLNAIQAIEGAGRVQVVISHQENYAVVRVADTGHGISPKNLPKIFRPFFTTKGQGTGLGLSLARNIVEEHGGRIEVTSTADLGTEFTLRFPLRNHARTGMKRASEVVE
jgi:two-component system NtrC family sensor kinase